MFGQWALGASPIGEPEEFASTGIPAEAFVWFEVAVVAEVEMIASNATVGFEQ